MLILFNTKVIAQKTGSFTDLRDGNIYKTVTYYIEKEN